MIAHGQHVWNLAPKAGPNTFIYQIFYDEASRGTLDAGFIPLNNCNNTRPDWFEFWPIRRFLLDAPLEEDAWYGFLSPIFRFKTGLDSKVVSEFLQQVDPHHANVALFASGWDQIAYFRNIFEQGEFWHPGLIDGSQKFFDRIGLTINLLTLTTHSLSSVFSNYLVAKPCYWRHWLKSRKFILRLRRTGGRCELCRFAVQNEV